MGKGIGKKHAKQIRRGVTTARFCRKYWGEAIARYAMGSFMFGATDLEYRAFERQFRAPRVSA